MVRPQPAGRRYIRGDPCGCAHYAVAVCLLRELAGHAGARGARQRRPREVAGGAARRGWRREKPPGGLLLLRGGRPSEPFPQDLRENRGDVGLEPTRPLRGGGCISKTTPRMCKIFNCDRRHGNFCCADCGYKRNGNCKNPCLNGPERCNCVAEPETKKPKTGGNTK